MNTSSLLPARPRAGFGLLAGLAVLAVSATGWVHAESLSFHDALVVALREAPTLARGAALAEAARQAAFPAGALPDPKLMLAIDNLPIEGANRFDMSRDFMTMRRFGISQVFPSRAKRDAQADAALDRVDIAEMETRITRLTVLRATATAWIARNSAEQQLARLDALLDENRLLDAAVRARLAGGQGMAAEAVVPRQEAALLEDRRDELFSRRAQAIATLRRWIGAAADWPLAGTAPDWPISREALIHGLHRHPELGLFESRKQLLEAETTEARAAKKPDWELALAYQDRAAQFGDMVSLQVSFDLPLFADSRQNPRIAAKRAEQVALAAEYADVLREHEETLEAGLAEYRRLSNVRQRQRDVLLALADEKVALMLAAWRGSKGSLLELVTARRERIDAGLKAIALDGDRQQLAARLHYSYGDLQGELQ